MARLAALSGAFLLLALCDVTMSITVQEFFPDAKGNLTKLKWAHRTNNQTELKKVLNSTEIQMIEADVIMGKLKGAQETDKEIPVMGHPPQVESDLSLEEFVKKVVANKTKGMKLDFKNITAFELGITILQNTPNLTSIPVWLNADILKGPIGSNVSEPIDAKKFLEGAARLPQAVLSIGWTTSLLEPAANATTANYTIDQIKEMSKLVSGRAVNQSVTYPVRACYAANDVDGFELLLNDTKNSNATLTVWSSEGDPVNATLLSQVIKRIGLDKVYVDVPASLFAKLDLSSSAFSAKSSLGVMIVGMVVALFGDKLL